MKFTVQRNDLLTELGLLRRVSEKRVTIPVLSCVLIESGDGSLSLTATDLDTTLRTTCPAVVAEAGAVVLPLRKLRKILKALPGPIVSFAKNAHTISITSGRVTFELFGQEKEHWPSSLAEVGEYTMSIAAPELNELIARTIYAITQEESRYSLNGALFEIGKDTLRLVATDGHRLALATGPLENPGAITGKCLVVKKALKVLAALYNGLSRFEFGYDDSHAYFRVDGRELTTRTPSGKFPDYHRVLPGDNTTELVIGALELGGSIKRVGLMAEERSGLIRIKASENALTVSSEDHETGKAEETTPAEGAPEIPSIGFNSRYLLDFLQTLNGERVNIAFKIEDDNFNPIILKPDGADNYTYVVMPIKGG